MWGHRGPEHTEVAVTRLGHRLGFGSNLGKIVAREAIFIAVLLLNHVQQGYEINSISNLRLHSVLVRIQRGF
jgi:hypothetical protein